MRNRARIKQTVRKVLNKEWGMRKAGKGKGKYRGILSKIKTGKERKVEGERIKKINK